MKKLLALLFILFLAGAVSAKSFSLPKAEIFMHLNDDASVNVTEKITFIFSGSFSSFAMASGTSDSGGFGGGGGGGGDGRGGGAG